MLTFSYASFKNATANRIHIHFSPKSHFFYFIPDLPYNSQKKKLFNCFIFFFIIIFYLTTALTETLLTATTESDVMRPKQ